MTAAAAQKKMLAEPVAEATIDKRANGMWIDRAHLPTALAQRGKIEELSPLQRWSSIRRELPNRILDYADLVLGINDSRRATDKKKKYGP